MNDTFRFVVMGDMHYVREASHQNTLNGKAKGVTEFADVTRNLWMTKNVTPEVISEIASLKPDFVIQTGDIIQGHCDDEESGLLEMSEAMDLLEGLKSPLFFALGTHDGVVGKNEEEQVKQFVYPAISKSLGVSSIKKGYYTFEKAGSLFIILDYTTFNNNDGQLEFIQQAFENSKNFEHIFLFAHPPLFCVGRPFFTDFNFVNTVLREIETYPIDAYFCGHTHNQVSTFHQVGKGWLPQLKSSILGYPEMDPISLKDVRPLLPDPSTYEFGWGYLEDSAPGWWEITVDGEDVQADWHVLRHGIMGQICWKRGEKPRITKKPTFINPTGHKLSNLQDIRSVRLRAAGSHCRLLEKYSVSLNGTKMGVLPRLEYFDSRQFMEIQPSNWPLINEINRLEITTPKEDAMCIGGFVLEVETKEGFIRSSVSGYYSNTDKWDHWNEPLTKITKGQTIHIHLSFN